MLDNVNEKKNEYIQMEIILLLKPSIKSQNVDANVWQHLSGTIGFNKFL